MRLTPVCLLTLVYVCLTGWPMAHAAAEAREFGDARRIGRIEANGLMECSGMDASSARDGLLWAVNDGGNGPYLFAMGTDGSDRGRVRIDGAHNRDWEDLATFMWQARPMVLIADIGDNRRRYGTYTLYFVDEPHLDGGSLPPSAVGRVAWRIDFTYPDRNHDAEGVAVDAAAGEILILTKRDDPPVLFSLPVKAAAGDRPVVARRRGSIGRIPPPTPEDLLYAFGSYRSQPTALDLSVDGRHLVALTYKHAYRFTRSPGEDWGTVVGGWPAAIPLPPPQGMHGFDQREALCYSATGDALFVTSEGRHPGLFRVNLDGP